MFLKSILRLRMLDSTHASDDVLSSDPADHRCRSVSRIDVEKCKTGYINMDSAPRRYDF